MAAKVARRHRGKYGIGFVLTKESGIVGIDLDACRDPETGAFEGWAIEVMRLIKSYWEVSPSGTGIKGCAYGEKPGPNCKRNQVEAYDSGRFFTMTGQHIIGTPQSIQEQPSEIAAFYYSYLGDPEPSQPRESAPPVPTGLSDEAVLQKIMNYKHGNVVKRLWNGDISGFPSHSEADESLCSRLYFFSGNPEQVDRLFRRSGLLRDKWDEVHFANGLTYGEGTLRKVCVGPTYSGSTNRHSASWRKGC
jgi:putative DNA primase/helicase